MRHKKRRNFRKIYRTRNDAPASKCKQSRCKEKIAGATKYCLKHWCAILRNNNHGKKKAAFNVDFFDIWQSQKGKCAVTGIELIPGKTASLDHINPLSRGGTNSRENLQFVHIAINTMKQNLTSDEFLELLKQLLPKLQGFVDRQKEE
jgi:5-methylcytosine-specific restriction endonuclease McrA